MADYRNDTDEKLIIKKKPVKGEDGYKVFSVRLREETLSELDAIATATRRSRNEVISILLEYAMKNTKIGE